MILELNANEEAIVTYQDNFSVFIGIVVERTGENVKNLECLGTPSVSR